MHYEQFNSGVVGLHNTGFTVNLTLSGRSLEVRANQTLLDALLEQGVDAYYDCRSGVCGSCMVPMTAGQSDHRDTFLSEAEKQENSLICTCVSRAMPGVTLELDI
ncbi:2Fe-2S iron-sulfur cluster-binding protein [Metapseudomonas lalkuanensis]|uniref:2Fe-2S iron-sulfur cluster-binding protein n=1 Tax=Metapseudomonas lalkuanensis TaxID=2604832 RepID=UPI0015B7329A|nr:2Fe-2S iron-sulfur cluster binding domain-containing protein [Pseudomonas lalkuanensis]